MMNQRNPQRRDQFGREVDLTGEANDGEDAPEQGLRAALHGESP